MLEIIRRKKTNPTAGNFFQCYKFIHCIFMSNTEFLITASQKNASNLGKRRKRQEENGRILKLLHKGRKWNQPVFQLAKQIIEGYNKGLYNDIQRILPTMTLESLNPTSKTETLQNKCKGLLNKKKLCKLPSQDYTAQKHEFKRPMDYLIPINYNNQNLNSDITTLSTTHCQVVGREYTGKSCPEMLLLLFLQMSPTCSTQCGSYAPEANHVKLTQFLPLIKFLFYFWKQKIQQLSSITISKLMK